MSYINSALRKVQKERHSRYAPYTEIISGAGGTACQAGAWRAFVFPAVLAVLLAILVLLTWLLYRTATRPVQGAAAVAEVATAEPRKALPDSAPREVRAPVSQAVRLYEAALAAQRGQKWEEAENLYKQVLAVDPRHAHSLNNLGVIYMSQRRFDGAMELFVKAMAAQRDYVDSYYNLACLYSQLGDIRASLGFLERAAQINGKVRGWAKLDVDFEKMRALPEFKKITEELVK